MDSYTKAMLDIISMPNSVNIKGKQFTPDVLFSPALCEAILFWHASSLSMRLHDEVLLGTRVFADKTAVSGVVLKTVDKEGSILSTNGGLGLASGLLLLSASGDQIISPARKHKAFDYEPLILSFREAVNTHYDHGREIDPSDHVLNTLFYDNIIKPSRGQNYQPQVNKGVTR